MKVIIIASIEPEYLKYSLPALQSWLDSKDIFVLNNASSNDNFSLINSISLKYGVECLRYFNFEQNIDTKYYINDSLKRFCSRFQDEIVLKIDEDTILFCDQSSMTFERDTFWFPCIDISNYFTRFFIDNLWPDKKYIYENNPFMWHNVHPVHQKNFAATLFDLIYKTEPATLIELCKSTDLVEYMSGKDPVFYTLPHQWGISITAFAFHASDYLKYFNVFSGVDEQMVTKMVELGVARYQCNYKYFCHHISYYTTRHLCKENASMVDNFNQKIMKYYSNGS